MAAHRIIVSIGLALVAGIAMLLAWRGDGPAGRASARAGPLAPPGPAAITLSDTQAPPPSAPREVPPEADPTAAVAVPARTAAPPAFLRGRVRTTALTAVPQALVLLGSRTTRTDAAGAFLFALDGVAADADLVALTSGLQPVVIANALAAVPPGEVLEVILPGPAESITGTLFDAFGNPGKGWNLELADGTAIDLDCFPPVAAEDMVAGAEVQRTPDGRGPEPRSPNRLTVPADGSFEVHGLRAGRTYVLRAWNPQTLEDVRSEPILAGTRGAVFRVPPTPQRERVWGQVVDRFGQPIEGVRVRLTMSVHTSGGSTSYQTGQECETTADGRFAFQAVPRRDLLLRFTGEPVASLYREFPATEEGTGLRIELSAMCALRFETLPGLAVPDALRILDAGQEALRMRHELQPGLTQGGQQVQLASGASHKIRVADSAAWVVLLREGAELRRVPITLSRATLTVVRG